MYSFLLQSEILVKNYDDLLCYTMEISMVILLLISLINMASNFPDIAPYLGIMEIHY